MKRPAGIISGDLTSIFVDGTKMESVANKYKYVWKKNIVKNREKLLAKLSAFVRQAEEECSVSFTPGKAIRKRHLEILRRKQQAKRKAEGICFIHGSGKRKTQLQKTFEQKKTGIKNDNLVTVWMFMPVYL